MPAVAGHDALPAAAQLDVGRWYYDEHVEDKNICKKKSVKVNKEFGDKSGGTRGEQDDVLNVQSDVRGRGASIAPAAEAGRGRGSGRAPREEEAQLRLVQP